MDLRMSERHKDIRRRASELVEKLYEYELPCEENNGLSEQDLKRIYDLTVEYGFNAMNMPTEWGGAGLSRLEQVIAKEQFGKLTNGLWWLIWTPANALRACTSEQRERYLLPTIRGERWEAVAVSEPGAGSDPRRIQTTARRTDRGYVINGEKWFVSAGDRADYLIVQARVQPGDHHTLFLVDKDTPGLTVKRTPHFMHTFVFEHPEFLFEDVEVGEDAVLGQVGAGFDLSKAWFLDARLSIGAHTLGAAERSLRVATGYALERETFDKKLIDNQYIQGFLVDSAMEIAAHRALVYQVAWEADNGVPLKRLHAKAGVLKAACAEAAGRCIDRCLQVLGGRGYMRENPVERLYRDIRVDRIWEGSSEISRMIVANEIVKRGLDGLLEHPGFDAPDVSADGADPVVQQILDKAPVPVAEGA